ncbi:MAG: TlpA disulfide reductase family protein [Burkholderiaceae bacterium]
MSWRRRDALFMGLATLSLTLSSGPARGQPASAAAQEAAAPPLPPVGSVLNVPAIDMLGGGVFDPAASHGKPLLVYWWSSTCPFCALQSPAMQQFWERHKKQGLQMLALSIDKKPGDAVAYLAKKGYSFPSAWASPAWRKSYPKPKGLPITLLADGQGRLVVAEKGQMFAEDVEAMAQFL